MIFAIAIPLALGSAHAYGADVGITIKTFQFKPNEVSVHPGDRVIVVNQDGIQHSLTADASGPAGPLFDTDFIAKGGEGTFVAPPPGVYPFHCKRHNSMTGTLKVE
jgi:plastocyanin